MENNQTIDSPFSTGATYLTKHPKKKQKKRPPSEKESDLLIFYNPAIN